MFGSEIIEVAIGLIFVYILLSLFCSTVAELFARFMALRSSTLEKGIRNLLSTDPNVASQVVKDFYDHPLISKLGLKGQGFLVSAAKKGNPSYISSQYFALALYDTLFPDDPVNGPKNFQEVRAVVLGLPRELQKPLLAYLGEAQGELTAFRKGIESWYDELMERVNGWYTRKTQLITLLIALVVTVIFNADTIMMANMLTRNASLRDAIVNAAGQLDPGQQDVEQELSKLQNKLLGTGLVGWMQISENYDDAREYPGDAGGWLAKAAGLLLTAGLVSLGAPFWFDILNKITNIRATSAPPEENNKGGKEAEAAPPTLGDVNISLFGGKSKEGK